jgi:hypothetical protein
LILPVDPQGGVESTDAPNSYIFYTCSCMELAVLEWN